MTELCKLATEKSPKIWDKLKELGRCQKPEKVLEIVKDDQSISRNISEILERWHHDIAKLYSGLREDPDVSFDDNFYNEIIAKKKEFAKLRYVIDAEKGSREGVGAGDQQEKIL